MSDQLTLIEFSFIVLQSCLSIQRKTHWNNYFLIGEIPQDEAAAEVHFIQIAAGGVNWIIPPGAGS